jgi:hypothetical protein
MALRALKILFAAALVSTSSMAAADLPTTWDGLVEVKSKTLEYVYLLPNADFRPYTKIQYQPVQIALQKNWLDNYNATAVGLSNQIDPGQVREAIKQATAQFDKYFANAFSAAGYTVVTAPGPGVLLVSPSVLNVTVTAPDQSDSIGQNYATSAGQATFVVDVRDSVTNQLMGRAIDAEIAGNDGGQIRTQASNTYDFDNLFKAWAKESVAGLNELKSLSPVDVNGMLKK